LKNKSNISITLTINFRALIFHIILAVFFAWLGNTQQDNVFGIINWVIGIGYALISVIEAYLITVAGKHVNTEGEA